MTAANSRADKETDADAAEPHPTDFNAFQLNIMAVLADGERHGLGVRAHLRDYYGTEINHGRLYPALNDLVDEGLVEKRELDGRTNGYSLTSEGRRLVERQHAWLSARLWGGSDE